MENYPSLEKFASTTDDTVEDNGYQGFFTTKQINAIADGFSYKEEIFNIGLQLGISHSISLQYMSRYDSLPIYAVDVIKLWRETYNTGEFEACRKLDSILSGVDCKGNAAKLVSAFFKWVNGHVCCRDMVEKNAKYAIKKLSDSKRSTGLRQSVVDKFNKWCRQQRLENDNFNMALYFQLYGSQLYEQEREYIDTFMTSLSILNTSLKHHLPYDAFFLTVNTNMDMKSNVAISSSYLVKEITEFLHPRRLAKICDDLPNMDVVTKLAHSLDVPDKIIRRAEYRHGHRNTPSMFMVAYDILCAWKRDCPYVDENDQVLCLIDALKEIDMNYMAHEIYEDFRAWEMSPEPELQICSCEISKKRSCRAFDVEEEEPNRKKSTRTEMVMMDNVAISSYLVKEITEFLHPRRLAEICDDLPSMEVVTKLAHSLDVPDKKIRRAEYRHQGTPSMCKVAYDILYAWKQNCPYVEENDRVLCLIDALEEIDMNYMASKIKEDFRAWEMSPEPDCSSEISKKRSFKSLDVEEEKPHRKKSTQTEM